MIGACFQHQTRCFFRLFRAVTQPSRAGAGHGQIFSLYLSLPVNSSLRWRSQFNPSTTTLQTTSLIVRIERGVKAAVTWPRVCQRDACGVGPHSDQPASWTPNRGTRMGAGSATMKKRAAKYCGTGVTCQKNTEAARQGASGSGPSAKNACMFPHIQRPRALHDS